MVPPLPRILVTLVSHLTFFPSPKSELMVLFPCGKKKSFPWYISLDFQGGRKPWFTEFTNQHRRHKYSSSYHCDVPEYEEAGKKWPVACHYIGHTLCGLNLTSSGSLRDGPRKLRDKVVWTQKFLTTSGAWGRVLSYACSFLEEGQSLPSKLSIVFVHLGWHTFEISELHSFPDPVPPLLSPTLLIYQQWGSWNPPCFLLWL